MRLPRVRVTVRRLMVGVAVVAVNFGLIRGAEDLTIDSPTLYVVLPAYALVPSLSLLAVAALSAGLGLVTRGRASPFATGYLLLGGPAFCVACLAVAMHLPTYFVFEILGPAMGRPPLGDRFADVLMTVVMACSQVLPALVGGSLAARLGLTIVLSGRPSTTGSLSTKLDGRPS
jgi:hypothetical protein